MFGCDRLNNIFTAFRQDPAPPRIGTMIALVKPAVRLPMARLTETLLFSKANNIVPRCASIGTPGFVVRGSRCEQHRPSLVQFTPCESTPIGQVRFASTPFANWSDWAVRMKAVVKMKETNLAKGRFTEIFMQAQETISTKSMRMLCQSWLYGPSFA